MLGQNALIATLKSSGLQTSVLTKAGAINLIKTYDPLYSQMRDVTLHCLDLFVLNFNFCFFFYLALTFIPQVL